MTLHMKKECLWLMGILHKTECFKETIIVSLRYIICILIYGLGNLGSGTVEIPLMVYILFHIF